MNSKNKFGFDPITEQDLALPRRREVGPMGAAVRETASSLNESTETLVEQRRQNSVDAKEFRKAQTEGRVLVALALDSVHTDDLPRDRLDLGGVANSDEMEELKASIRERGQKEPVEVFEDSSGTYQLKKGWRRLTALRQLFEESGDDRFSTVMARVAGAEGGRIDLYIDMVEENVIREDLSFAEMAQVAITAAADPAMDGGDADALVGRLYGALHKMKRSYIRSFVFLLQELAPTLAFPKAVSRNLGVDVARKLKEHPDGLAGLRSALDAAGTEAEQSKALAAFLEASLIPQPTNHTVPRAKSVKYEFHVGSVKVTARKGECRILSKTDFSAVDRGLLQRAIEAFEAVLAGK
jgi:ParB family chromosome partitioning protein